MLFLKHILNERANDFSVTRCELQADCASGRLVVTDAVFMNGTWRHTWEFAAFSKDLDPERISLEPKNSSGVRLLGVTSVFYRKAVVGTFSGFDAPPRQTQVVGIGFPLVGDLTDPDQVLDSFRDFLLSHGARTPTIRPDVIRDQLTHLHAAVAPASGVPASKEAKSIAREYRAVVSEDLLLLKIELPRRRMPPLKWTFELLSLDTAAVVARESDGYWVVTLPSVGSLETTLFEWPPNLHRQSTMRVYFQSQAPAEHFAAVCVRIVPEMRERLYAAHLEN